MKRALITGVTGQDGSYLAELLLEKGYEVYGLVRRTSTFPANLVRVKDNKNLKLIEGEMTDQRSLIEAVKKSQPDECYNLSAQSFVQVSWKQPFYTIDVNAVGFLRLLEAIRLMMGSNNRTKVYQASSSEMWGNMPAPQNEQTQLSAESPYGLSKIMAHQLAHCYRNSYNMFICCGILTNHESPRRGLEFVTKKIVRHVAEIKFGLRDKLVLGDLNSRRDWGYSKEFCEAMYLMLQQDKPDDYVIATNETHTIKEFVDEACLVAGLKDIKIESSPDFMRPSDVKLLQGDYSKAKEKLGWCPRIKFKELVRLMVEYELKELESRNK